MNKYYDPNQFAHAEQVTINLRPKGYAKCHKEYKEVIDFLENKIKKLEKNRDLTLIYLDKEINSIFSLMHSTNDQITKNYFADRIQPYIDIKYLLVQGSENND